MLRLWLVGVAGTVASPILAVIIVWSIIKIGDWIRVKTNGA